MRRGAEFADQLPELRFGSEGEQDAAAAGRIEVAEPDAGGVDIEPRIEVAVAEDVAAAAAADGEQDGLADAAGALLYGGGDETQEFVVIEPAPPARWYGTGPSR